MLISMEKSVFEDNDFLEFAVLRWSNQIGTLSETADEIIGQSLQDMRIKQPNVIVAIAKYLTKVMHTGYTCHSRTSKVSR